MKNKEKELLPIGTVLILKGAKKRIMITGYFPIIKNEDGTTKKFDYAACIFPEGTYDSDNTIAFNTELIDKIYHYGLKDDELSVLDGSLIIIKYLKGKDIVNYDNVTKYSLFKNDLTAKVGDFVISNQYEYNEYLPIFLVHHSDTPSLE